jgi:hypothetical protein
MFRVSEHMGKFVLGNVSAALVAALPTIPINDTASTIATNFFTLFMTHHLSRTTH